MNNQQHTCIRLQWQSDYLLPVTALLACHAVDDTRNLHNSLMCMEDAYNHAIRINQGAVINAVLEIIRKVYQMLFDEESKITSIIIRSIKLTFVPFFLRILKGMIASWTNAGLPLYWICWDRKTAIDPSVSFRTLNHNDDKWIRFHSLYFYYFSQHENIPRTAAAVVKPAEFHITVCILYGERQIECSHQY